MTMYGTEEFQKMQRDEVESVLKERMTDRVNDLQALVRSGEVKTEEIIEEIQDIIDTYVDILGKRPDGTELTRMATLILHEDLSDKRSNKMSVEEFPVMSDDQLRVRYERETSDAWASSIASDGIDYQTATRDYRRKMREVSTRTR